MGSKTLFLWWRVGELDFSLAASRTTGQFSLVASKGTASCLSGGEMGNWTLSLVTSRGTEHFCLWLRVGELNFFSSEEYGNWTIFSGGE